MMRHRLQVAPGKRSASQDFAERALIAVFADVHAARLAIVLHRCGGARQ